jgi:hypothetical protein
MTGEIRSKVSVCFPRKAFTACIFLGLALLLPCPAQVPVDLLKHLAAEEFKSRQAAEEGLTKWAFDNREPAYDLLYRHSREHPDAEVRVRCLSVLRRLVSDIYEFEGEGYVGIRMKDEAMLLPGQGEEPVAVLQVMDVMPDSPAAKGGLLAGDTIVSLQQAGWKRLPASDDFRNRIKSIKPRSLVTLQVLREGQLVEIEIRLARRPAAAENPFVMPDQDQIKAMEEVLREEHFKKWLLDRRNGR